MNDYQYYYYYNNEPQTPQEAPSVWLFTDRSIYRPGQTVFFKGIAVTGDRTQRKNNIVRGYETVVYLRDANDQEADSLKVKTNDYGSFSGKFQLPKTRLNRQLMMNVKDKSGLG